MGGAGRGEAAIMMEKIKIRILPKSEDFKNQ
jgi:hypothetical protein